MAGDAAHAPDAQPKAKIFISYSRKDMAFADRLEAALKARGFEVLIDRTEIYAFEDWWKRIEALIGSADTVVFVLSPEAVKSDVALREVGYAASLNKRFAPIVCRRVEDAAVPETLRRLNFIFFDDPEQFATGTDHLAEALETNIAWIRQHTEFGEAERRWSAAGSPNGLLLQSPTLDLAEYWLASRPRNAPEPTEEVRSYVVASRKRSRASQRTWRLVLASTFTFMAATILGLIGWINQSYIGEQWRWYRTERPFVAANIWPYVLRPAAAQALKPGNAFRECASGQGQDYCPEMVMVPAGSFTMGSPSTENGHTAAEEQHKVTIKKPFAVSKFEVTFNEWDTCVAYGDCSPHIGASAWGRGQQPVINETWDDAQAYVAWLSKMTKQPYRLLSEAEYEYATRAGTQTAYPWGDEIKLRGMAMANCDGCGSRWDNRAAPVGSFLPNFFDLYDMVGNVWEWLEDCTHADYNGAPSDGSPWMEGGNCDAHMVRGGSWGHGPADLRSAYRSGITAGYRGPTLGFRVARTLDVH
jgi:formylglycine-generating enzyme required for sulfatase activity